MSIQFSDNGIMLNAEERNILANGIKTMMRCWQEYRSAGAKRGMGTYRCVYCLSSPFYGTHNIGIGNIERIDHCDDCAGVKMLKILQMKPSP